MERKRLWRWRWQQGNQTYSSSGPTTVYPHEILEKEECSGGCSLHGVGVTFLDRVGTFQVTAGLCSAALLMVLVRVVLESFGRQ